MSRLQPLVELLDALAAKASKLADSITSFAHYDHMILMGDFNVDLLVTSNSDPRKVNAAKKLNEFLECFNLKNYVNKPTHFTADGSTLIDIFCTDAPIQDISVLKSSGLGGHAMILTRLKIKKPVVPPKRILYRPLKNIDIVSFEKDVAGVFWNKHILHCDVNLKTTDFNEKIIDLYDHHAPIKTVTISDKMKPWLTSNVRFMMQLRDKAHSVCLQTKHDTDIQEYKTLKHMVNVSLHFEKKAFFEYNINKNIGDGKKMWKSLKSSVFPKNSVSIPNHLLDPDILNDEFLTIPGHITTTISFLTYFEFNRFNNNYDSENNFSLSTVDEDSVLKIIIELKSNAIGADGISRDMMLLTLPHSLTAITDLVNTSIKSCVVPNQWKIALVNPIPKNNNPICAKDLRPVNVLPYQSKILEKVVYNQVVRYCEDNAILPVKQSGFRKNHSTSTALLDVIDNILGAQDNGEGTILVLLDFSRAFECLDITALLSKLSYYGFSAEAVKWFNSYLSERYQQTVLKLSDGSIVKSALKQNERGVPQGSHLGPVLFLLYTAGMVKCLHNCDFHFYADDSQVYISCKGENIANAVKKINADLDRIADWCEQNSLVLNKKKSKVKVLGTKKQRADIIAQNPIIHLKGEPLEFVEEARNLGVLMDCHLKFEKHVAEVARNCFFRLKLLYKIRKYISIQVRVTLCDSLVLSRLNYAISAYGPCLLKKTQRVLQRVQNACVRYCYNVPPRTHVTPYINNAKLLKMKNRQDLYFANLLFGIIKHKKPEYLYSKLKWRKASRLRSTAIVLHTAQHKRVAFRGSFRYQASKCWNNIPPPIRGANTKAAFKTNYKKYLLEVQIEYRH